MGMGATGGMPRSVILAQAKREIAQLEGRTKATQESIGILEAAVGIGTPDTYTREEKIERMLEAVINVQLATLKNHLQEGTTQLEMMKASVTREESLVKPASASPLSTHTRRQ